MYAIAKIFLWILPNGYGKNKVVHMLSALHIEMVMLSCIGDLLEDSDWTTVLSNDGFTTRGNDALLTSHTVIKSKYMQEVTARALFCATLPYTARALLYSTLSYTALFYTTIHCMCSTLQCISYLYYIDL